MLEKGDVQASVSDAGKTDFDEILNCRGLIRKGLDDTDISALIEHHELYNLGGAVDDGGCFFDALAQSLNVLQKTAKYNEKCLRELCYSYYQEHKAEVDEWHKKDYRGGTKIVDYFFIQYTSKEIESFSTISSPIWGRPTIEGLIICRKLNLEAILVIEALRNPETNVLIPNFIKITKDDCTGIDIEIGNQMIKDNNVPAIAASQSKLHFVPLLAKTDLKNLASKNPRITKDHLKSSSYKLEQTHNTRTPLRGVLGNEIAKQVSLAASQLQVGNIAYHEFIGIGKVKEDYREYKTWYSDHILCYLLHSQASSKMLPFVFVSQDTKPDLMLQNQFEQLAVLKNDLKRDIAFIAMEPGIVGNPHFVCGIFSGNKLLIFNPTGQTKHTDFYNRLAAIKKNLNLEIYLSDNEIQLDKDGLVSCGPICAELTLELLQHNAEESLRRLIVKDPNQHKEGLTFTQCSITNLLPALLKNLPSGTADYIDIIKKIRSSHADRLLAVGQAVTQDDYWDKHGVNADIQVLLNKMLTEKLGLLEINNTPEYRRLAENKTEEVKVLEETQPVKTLAMEREKRKTTLNQTESSFEMAISHEAVCKDLNKANTEKEPSGGDKDAVSSELPKNKIKKRKRREGDLVNKDITVNDYDSPSYTDNINNLLKKENYSEAFEEILKIVDFLSDEFQKTCSSYILSLKDQTGFEHKCFLFSQEHGKFLERTVRYTSLIKYQTFNIYLSKDDDRDKILWKYRLPKIYVSKLCNKGILLFKENKLEEAKVFFILAIQFDKRYVHNLCKDMSSTGMLKYCHALPYYLLIFTYYKLKEYNAAVKEFESLPKIFDRSCITGLEGVYSYLNNEIIEKYLLNIVQTNDSCPSEIFYYAALSYKEISNEQKYKQYITSAYISRAKKCELVRNHKAAIDIYDIAIKIAPDNYSIYMLNGLAKFRLYGNEEVYSADGDLNKAAVLAKYPTQKLRIYYKLLVVCDQFGRIDKVKYFSTKIKEIKLENNLSKLYHWHADYHLMLVELGSSSTFSIDLFKEILSQFMNLYTFFRDDEQEEWYGKVNEISFEIVNFIKNNGNAELVTIKELLELLMDNFKTLLKYITKSTSVVRENSPEHWHLGIAINKKLLPNCIFERLYIDILSSYIIIFVLVQPIFEKNDYIELKQIYLDFFKDTTNEFICYYFNSRNSLASFKILLNSLDVSESIVNDWYAYVSKLKDYLQQYDLENDKNVEISSDESEKDKVDVIPDKSLQVEQVYKLSKFITETSKVRQFRELDDELSEPVRFFFDESKFCLSTFEMIVDKHFSSISQGDIPNKDAISKILTDVERMLGEYTKLIEQETHALSKKYKTNKILIFKINFYIELVNFLINYIKDHQVELGNKTLDELTSMSYLILKKIDKNKESIAEFNRQLYVDIFSNIQDRIDYALQGFQYTRIKNEYAKIRWQIESRPLTVKYGRDGFLIPFPGDWLKAVADETRQRSNISTSVNISSHIITIVYRKNKEKKIIHWTFKDSAGKPFVAYDTVPGGVNNNNILRRIQHGWDLINQLPVEDKKKFLFFKEKGRPAIFEMQKHKHSEQHYFETLNNLNIENFMQEVLKENPDLTPDSKILMISYDYFSDRTSCDNCKLSVVAEQKVDGEPKRFAQKLQKYFIEHGYKLPDRTGEPPRLTVIARILADQQHLTSRNNHNNPVERNIKNAKKLLIYESLSDKAHVSGSSALVTDQARDKFRKK